MKKDFLLLAVLFMMLTLSSCKYNDDDIWNTVNSLETRILNLEESCKQMNTNILAIQAIVNVCQDHDYITSVTPVIKGDITIGYTIAFKKSESITIYNGTNGSGSGNGSPTTPIIGVKKDTDGTYYWTINGEWLTDDDGNKIKTQGEDGKNGSDGKDGTDGKDGEDGKDGVNGSNGSNGKNGVTPQLKIEDDFWFVSYDNGKTWTKVGKAVSEGESDSMFSNIDYTTNSDYVIFTLTNGTEIKIPSWEAFESLKILCNQINTNLSSLQTIVTTLQNNDYITNVSPVEKDGKIIGYTISFAINEPIIIYNGKDVESSGNTGNTPSISIKKDEDGNYYWTLDGDYIMVDGQKVQAQGSNGTDGITPQLKIEDDYWYVSYDKGTNWEKLGKAKGEDGKGGDSIFTNVTQDQNNVYFTLTDGTVITISKTGRLDSDFILFDDPAVKSICLLHWDENKDGQLSYEEAAKVTSLNNYFSGNENIIMFNELQYFTGLTSINESAFSGCKNLGHVIIPASVTEIQKEAFKETSGLRGSITIPKSVTAIGESAFNGSYITEILFEENSSLSSIGKTAFSGTHFATIEIPSEVTEIGLYAFSSAYIKVISFEEGSKLTTIADGAFEMGTLQGAMIETIDLSYCENLQSINSTFYGMNNYGSWVSLPTLKIGTKTPPTLSKEIFPHGINDIYVPSESIEVYKSANIWSNHKDKIKTLN